MLRRQMIDTLAARLAALHRPHSVRVAIDGIDACGKTCLADELAQTLTGCGRPLLRASIDGFHQPRALRYQRGQESPEGYFQDSFDYQRLRADLLEPLGPGGSRCYRRAAFDYRQDRPLELAEEIADPHSILLFDGIFLLRAELAAFWDFRIFVQVSFETSLARAIKRDLDLFGGPEAVRQRYEQRYFPAQRLYLERCHPLQQADVILHNDDLENPEMQLRASRQED